MVRAAHLALTFLTTLPLPNPGEVRSGEFARASGFYPLAGYMIGALAALTLLLGHALELPGGVSAALTLALWLTVTGMLHFDGLVDAGDALLVARSPQRRLEILADVHIGAFGLAVGVLTLLTKWSLLAALEAPWILVAVAVAARVAVLAPMNLYPAARQGSLGARSRQGWWPLALLLALPALLIPGAAITFVAALAAALLVAAFAARRLGGGLNGDVYGAIIELAEIAALIAWTALQAKSA
nr:adenosylcobinamide-GDP ribazoletransferase [Deinobacterium chartae]